MSLDFLKGGGDSARSSTSGGSSARTGTARSGYDSARSDASTARTSGANIIDPGSKKKKKKEKAEQGARAGAAEKGGDSKSIMMHPDLDDQEETERDRAAVSVRRKLQVYNKMLSKAGFGKAVKKHMSHISNMNGSNELPIGRVSDEIYESIYGARSFDRFGRPIYNRRSNHQQLVADIKSSFASASGRQGDPKGHVTQGIRTAREDIGYKKPVFAPPGLAPPVQKHLHSEENEGFFSYDGTWRNGRPNGLGKYLFMDKATYEGDFKNGIPHGEGVAVYPRNKEGAGMYSGWWKDGRYEGKGTFTYSTGSVYEGEWHRGLRHGRGKLTFPSGFCYEGEWYMGKQHGNGTVKSPQTRCEYRGIFEKGLARAGSGTLKLHEPNTGRTKILAKFFGLPYGCTLKDIRDLMQREWMDEKKEKEQDLKYIYGINVAIHTQEYVNSCRQDIYDQRKAIKDAEEYERLKIAREKREKMQALKMSSLVGDADDGDGGEGGGGDEKGDS